MTDVLQMCTSAQGGVWTSVDTLRNDIILVFFIVHCISDVHRCTSEIWCTRLWCVHVMCSCAHIWDALDMHLRCAHVHLRSQMCTCAHVMCSCAHLRGISCTSHITCAQLHIWDLRCTCAPQRCNGISDLMCTWAPLRCIASQMCTSKKLSKLL